MLSMKKAILFLGAGVLLMACGSEEEAKQKSLEELEQEEVCTCVKYADKLFASDDLEKFANDHREEHDKCAGIEKKYAQDKLSSMREKCQ